MKMARKILFDQTDPESGKDIDGLIASLKKSSPGTLARLKDSGGRIYGHAMADDHEGKQVDPNSARTTKAKKC